MQSMPARPSTTISNAVTSSPYTADECLTWRILFDRQTALLYRRAPAAFFEGLRALGLSREAPPDLLVLSKRLQSLTGWSLVPARGRISDETYLEMLADRKLPVATWLRARRDTEFLPGPDLFHDVFGHLPLLAAEPTYAAFLAQVGQLARQQHVLGSRAAPWLTRLLWHTTEFGLLTGADGRRVVIGAGLLSSAAELHFALASDTEELTPRRLDFSVPDILASPVVRAEFQPKYFELSGWEQLLTGFAEVATRLSAPGSQPVTPVPAHTVVLTA
jgi:phenylalanine-4-hydroxylase